MLEILNLKAFQMFLYCSGIVDQVILDHTTELLQGLFGITAILRTSLDEEPVTSYRSVLLRSEICIYSS